MSHTMTDQDLIGYCDLHCETPRALFNSYQINRMIALANYPDTFVQSVPLNQWLSVHDDMKDLCRLARAQLSKNDRVTNSVADINEYNLTNVLFLKRP